MSHLLARPALIALACVGPTVALAQNPPATTSRPTTERADDALDRLLGPRLQRPATDAAAATRSDSAARTGVAPDAAPARLLREGTFLVDRVGHVRETDSGDLEFVFAADNATAASADAPMRLVPNLNLMAIDGQPLGREGRRYRVTGRVTEYRGRNYLILDKVVFLDD